jgi:hypothetical protein
MEDNKSPVRSPMNSIFMFRVFFFSFVALRVLWPQIKLVSSILNSIRQYNSVFFFFLLCLFARTIH